MGVLGKYLQQQVRERLEGSDGRPETGQESSVIPTLGLAPSSPPPALECGSLSIPCKLET